MGKDAINGVGALFRFVTPIMIGLVAYFGNMTLAEIKTNQEIMKNYFTNHLHEHSKESVMFENRMTRLETQLSYMAETYKKEKCK